MDFQSMGSALKDEKGAALHLKSPDDFPLYAQETEEGWSLTIEKTEHPCELQIVGQYSERFRNRKRTMFNLMQNKKNKAHYESFDEAEAEDLATVAAAIVNWNNIPKEGKIAEFSMDNVLELFRDYPPAFDAANSFIVENGNFFDSASMLS